MQQIICASIGQVARGSQFTFRKFHISRCLSPPFPFSLAVVRRPICVANITRAISNAFGPLIIVTQKITRQVGL